MFTSSTSENIELKSVAGVARRAAARITRLREARASGSPRARRDRVIRRASSERGSSPVRTRGAPARTPFVRRRPRG